MGGGLLEKEESENVKEPEQRDDSSFKSEGREDSSLKRGTSKISRALVCHLMKSQLFHKIKLPYKYFRTH